MGKLTAVKVRALTAPGRYGDGDGLYLLVRSSTRRSWLLRFMLKGRSREMGLGSADDVSLADARLAAQQAHKQLRNGTDPLIARRTEVGKEARAPTFQEVADRYIAAHEAGWRNAKHAAQWRSTLARAHGAFGASPVGAIDTGAVMTLLEPIWRQTPETASRLRGRIEAVLDYAKARSWREGENPARWRGHLANLLPARGKIRRVQHHPALPWRDVGAFMAQLRSEQGTAARALEWTILTAARTGEAIGAPWSEIDRQEKVWTIPPERMKGGIEHRVPLSSAALAVLNVIEPDGRRNDDAYLFATDFKRLVGRPLSSMAMTMLLRRMGRGDITVHGFRSTFRDWCAEATSTPRELAEAALAHTVRDKVEAAYQRGAMLERRRGLMEDWAAFCAREGTANVAKLADARKKARP